MKARSLFAAVILLIIILIVFWMWNQPTKKHTDTLINTTGKEQSQGNKNQLKTAEKPIKSKPEIVSVAEWEVPIINEIEKDRNYLTVYKDLRFAKRCEAYYQAEHQQKSAFNAHDYYAELLMNPALGNVQPSEIQVSTFQAFLGACDELKKATFIRANIEQRYPKSTKPYIVIAELEKELEITPVETDEERSLKTALQLKQNWQQLFEELITASTGALVMSDAEIKEARNELLQLSQQMIAFTSDSENYDADAMNEIMDKINDLRKAMEETQGGDETKRQQLLSELSQSEQQLLKLLQSPHIETFIVAMTALEFSAGLDMRVATDFSKHKFQDVMKHIPEFVSPSQVLRVLSGAPDDKYYNVLILPASALYLCKRGYDCSETSELITDYCWGSLDKIKIYTGQIHPEACGLDVETFILNHFLTTNQKNDVLKLVQLMEEQYAP